MADELDLTDAFLTDLCAAVPFVRYDPSTAMSPSGTWVCDAIVPKTPPGQYVVVYPSMLTPTRVRLDGAQVSASWSVRCVCAGRTREAAMNTARLLSDRMRGRRLDPAHTAGSLRDVDIGAPVLRDDTVSGDVRFSVTRYFRLSTARSTP